MKIRSILLPALALSFASSAAFSMDDTRTQVQADLAAWQANPVSGDGYRFVGGEIGHLYEPPGTAIGSGTGAAPVTHDQLMREYQQFRDHPITTDGYRFVGGEVGYVLEKPSAAAPVMSSGTGTMPHSGMQMRSDDRYHENSVSADGYRFMGGDLGYEYEGIAR